jgi:hypothetical protein
MARRLKEGENVSMTNKLSSALALLAGLAGGLLTRYIAPPPAFAQTQTPVTKEVRAQSFTLVDSSDRAAGTFSVELTPHGMSPYRIILKDANGSVIWTAGGSAIRPAVASSK